MTATLRVLTADDEPLARQRLRELLAAMPDVTLVAECANGLSAFDAIVATAPDVVLLDVQMPGRDGVALAESLRASGGAPDAPVVIFVTAFAEHAVRAFDVQAADYLLKPFTAERLTRALDQARATLLARRAGTLHDLHTSVRDDLRTLLDDRTDAPQPVSRFAVSVGKRTLIIQSSAIHCVRAEGNYVRLITARESPLLRASMREMERDLDPAVFARVHRSAIVRLDLVREIRPAAGGAFVLVLDGAAEVPLSAHYRHRFG
jgi:two-component system, LytTR family, response regulator